MDSLLAGGGAAEPSGLPPGGPRSWWRGPAGVRIGGPPARVAEERAGWERLAGHPARPEVLAWEPDGVWVEPLGPPPEDPLLALAAWPAGEPALLEGRVGALLAQVPGTVDPARALVKLGLQHGAVQRWLASPTRAQTRVGQSPGPLAAGWLRVAGTRVVALRWSRAQARGWWAASLAAVALSAGEDARDLHAEGLDPALAEVAYDLALLRVALDEAVLGADPHAAAEALGAVERLRRPPPPQVRVSIAGPPWLDPGRWLPPDGVLPTARARALVHLLDGQVLAGTPLAVRLDPPVRVGRRPPPREAQAQRRRRLFSRWDEGVQVDEEGLFSATPEALAAALVRGLQGVVMDGTCGVGSLTLALAAQPGVREVIAVDLHPGRLAMARHNTRLYGVEGRVRWVQGDVAQALEAHPVDALVLDPPWGGRGWSRERVGLADLGLDLRAALARAPEAVVLKLPRSFALEELPGVWLPEAGVDTRGHLKLLIARSPAAARLAGRA